MKLLFIDHECHKKTRSAEFFLEVIRKAFDVTEHYYSRCYRTESTKTVKGFDTAVIWEFPISRKDFFFHGKKNVFVPMYDNEWGSYWQWKRIAWSGMGVISFCDKVSKHARHCGVANILDVRYFPDPDSLPHETGDPKRVFLWERGEICESVAKSLFPPSEGYIFDIKKDKEFLERHAYLARMAKCGVVIAPRLKEGIGMAFLEAMAMGKCVVAANDATMNEYIRHGETGILFTPGAERPVDKTIVAAVRKNIPATSEKFRARWLADREKINYFIAEQKLCKPSFVSMIKITLSYPVFLLEGAWHKMLTTS